MFKKSLTAGVLAVSLALTSLSPTQAAADTSDDAVAGLIALLLFGAAVHELRDRDRNEPERVHNDRWRVVPSACLRRINTQRGEQVRLFTRRCLNQNYAHVNRLPDRCERTVRNVRGNLRHGFAPRCLRNAGFRTDRH